jgi:hypothetical protein
MILAASSLLVAISAVSLAQPVEQLAEDGAEDTETGTVDESVEDPRVQGVTVGGNTSGGDVQFDFLNPQANNAAASAANVGNVSIDFGSLNISPSDLGGTSGLPPGYENYEADPASLENALSDPALSDLMNGFGSNDLGDDQFQDWVNDLIGGQGDPWEVTGMNRSTPESSCITTTQTREVVSRTTYSCSVDDGTQVDHPVCQEILVHAVDDDYLYTCEEDRLTTNDTWSASCEPLDGDPDCEQTDERCLEDQRAIPATYTCEAGRTATTSDEVCVERREYELDADYEYRCTRTWSNGQWVYSGECDALAANAGCDAGDSVCIEEGPPILEDYICENCPGAAGLIEDCRARLQIAMQTDYMYGCRQHWMTREHRWEFEDRLLCEALVYGCDQVEGWTCDTPGEVAIEERVCEIGAELSSVSQTCVQDALHTVDLDFEYECDEIFNPDTAEWEADLRCGVLDAAQGCTRGAETCELPRDPVYAQEQCRTGVFLGSQERSCQLPLEHLIDIDYIYGCERSWNPSTSQFEDGAGCSTLRSQCEFQVENCTTPAPPTYEPFTCRYGERAVVQEETVNRRLAIQVDADYIYQGFRDWNTSTSLWADDNDKIVLEAAVGCREVGQICVTDSPGVLSEHTCETGYRINTAQQACRSPRNVQVDVDYSYEAARDWNGSSFVPSWAHNRLVQYSCVQESSRCSQGSPGVYSYHQCRIGWRNNSGSEQCSRPRVVTVDADYQYRAYRDWNGSRWADTSQLSTLQGTSGCTQASTRCVTQSPGVYTTYKCQQGTQISSVNRTCDEYRNVTVTRRWQHAVSWLQNWAEPTPPFDLMGNYYGAGCTAEGSQQCSMSGWKYQTCTQQFICPVATVAGRTGTELSPATSDAIDSSQCNQHSSCTQTNRVCTEGAGTRTINGHQIYRSCWRWRRTYSCPTTTAVNTCSPASNAQHVRDRCLRMDGSSCGLTEREYRVPQPDPSGGCHRYEHTFWCENQVSGQSHTSIRRDVVGDTWNNSACTTSALGGGSCSLSSTRCVEGAATRTINGLAVYRSCWREERTYTCVRRENINTCSPPSGSSLTSQTCVWSDSGGTCRLWDRIYQRAESDPSGGCHQFTDRFRCENAVSLVGPVVQYHRSIASDTWDRSACASPANDNLCTLASRRCVVGAGTRTINGLAAYRDCWEEEDVYSCDTRQDLNTCNPPAGATRQSQTCLWSDSGGTCQLFRQTWVREEADPSGGCHRYQHRFLCEDYVGGIRTPIETQRNIVSETLTNAGPASQFDQQCDFTGRACTQGPATRTINGLSVTRDCWVWDYNDSCTTYQAFDGCQSIPAECSFEEEVCAETKPDGSCATLERRYQCALDDGSGGCHAFSSEYRCENQTSGVGPVLREIRTAGEGSFNEGACTAMQGDVGCSLTSTRCVDADPQTRTIDGVQITSACWQQERIYTCETQTPLDTCGAYSDCDLRTSVCETTAADGSCATTLNTYSCQVDDGSGGCNVRSVAYQCEGPVPAAGAPASSWVASQSSWGWDESCIASRPESSCVAVSEACQGSGTTQINPVITAAQLAADPDLAEYLGLSGVSPGSGHPGEILGAGGVWRISANDMSIPSIQSDCPQREAVYDCDVAEAINTCQEYESRTSGGSDQQASAAPLLQYASLEERRYQPAPYFNASGTLSIAALHATYLKVLPQGEDVVCDPDLVYGDPTECSISGEVDLCAIYPQACDPEYDPDPVPGEGEMGDCSLASQTCVATNRAGDCVRWQRRYECQIGDGSQGCSTRSDVWRCDSPIGEWTPSHIIQRPGERGFVWQGCEALDDATRCQKSGTPYCIDATPTEREIAPGVLASADCWEMAQDYQCDAVAPVAGCTATQGCTFVATECLERDFDGSCLRERHEYRCPADDPSGGCAVMEDTYMCEDEVPGAGHPSDMVATVVDEHWVRENCPPADSKQCVESPTEPVCIVDWAEPRPVDDYRWTGTVRDPYISQFEPEWDIFVNGCQAREQSFQCAEYTDVNTCDIPETCIQTGSSCIERDAFTNACIQNRLEYTCDEQPAGCVQREREFLCENLVDGAGPPDDTVTSVEGSSWENVDCPDVSDPELGCEPQETVCVEGPGTRRVAGIEVTEECWARETPYICEGVGEVITDCAPPEHCELASESCLDVEPSDSCQSLERVYDCLEVTQEPVTTEQCEGTVSCLDGNCVEVEREQSTNMPEALARLAGLSQAHDSTPNGPSLDLMGGNDLRCHKTGIWKNCCTNGGEGLAIDLLGGSCNEQEQELAHRTAEGLCVEVGWYCAERGWFGCRKRVRTSCCFGSELARIINEQGREQLGLGWGSPRSPQCGGLSPEQFSQLDLSNVDFSEVLSDVTQSFAPDGQGDVTGRIQDRLSDFYSSGQSTNIPGGGG